MTASLKSQPGIIPPGTLAPRVVFGGRAGNYITAGTTSYCSVFVDNGDGTWECNGVGAYRPFKYLRATTLTTNMASPLSLGWSSRALPASAAATATGALPSTASRQLSAFNWNTTE